MMDNMDVTERALAKMVESINKHLPERSRTLAEMLKEEFPTIKARDGNEYLIEREELEFIAKHVDELDWERFKIPIILEMCDIGGEVVIFVRDKLHAQFISRVFGIDRFVEGALMLYMYELPKIRRKLRTATQVLFTVTYR